MDINSNSFFFRRYLGYSRFNLRDNPHPNSICDLIWRFIKRTALYYLVLHVTVATAIMTIGMGLMSAWPQNVEGKTVYFGDHVGLLLDLVLGMPAVAGQFIIAAAAFLAVLFTGLWLVYTIYTGIIKILPKKLVASTTVLAVDISASIRGKSCAKINITNLPENH